MILHGRLIIDPDAPPAEGWIETDGDRISRVGDGAPPRKPDLGHAGALITPGFIDAHIHLPQFDSVGCDGLDLLDWLEEVIFPAETGWADQATVDDHVARAYRRMVRAGTLGYAGFLTSHPYGADAIRSRHRDTPLRAVVGRSLMDRHAPHPLVRYPFEAPPAPEPDGRLIFSVNPRFAITCSDELMSAAGAAARDGARVQTHLAEQARECAQVKALFPDDPHYTAVYDRAGLLTSGTLLAHCLHLSEPEWRLIAERGAAVVHCPSANMFLASGQFDLAAARDHGVRLALGSDLAAGCDLAMPRVARSMIEVAKSRRMGGCTGAPVPTPADGWRFITAGNADALGFAGAGRLEPGASADLLVLDPPVARDEHLIGRLLYTWRDDYITDRVLAGRRVEAVDF